MHIYIQHYNNRFRFVGCKSNYVYSEDLYKNLHLYLGRTQHGLIWAHTRATTNWIDWTKLGSTNGPIFSRTLYDISWRTKAFFLFFWGINHSSLFERQNITLVFDHSIFLKNYLIQEMKVISKMFQYIDRWPLGTLTSFSWQTMVWVE